MSRITTHVLDAASGQPAAGLGVTLEYRTGEDQWRVVGQGKTDADGRLKELMARGARLDVGVYRLRFDAAAYFAAQKTECFHPEIAVQFTVRDAAQDYHVPLLLSPYSYTTYLGS